MKLSHINSNSVRALAEVVSLDVWRTAVGKDSGKFKLHADVVFREGRLGAELESQVRFRLALRRAELVVIIPKTEPLSVDPSTVSRDTPNLSVHSTSTHSVKNNTGILSSASMGISSKGISAGIAGKAKASKKVDNTKVDKKTEKHNSFKIIQSQNQNQDYRWELLPSVDEKLFGHPWDAKTEPRMTLFDQRRDKLKGLPPVAVVEVRCLREDLIISDIKLKNNDIWEKLTQSAGFRNKEVAVEAYIRNRLQAEGLQYGNLSDAFSPIVLASSHSM